MSLVVPHPATRGLILLTAKTNQAFDTSCLRKTSHLLHGTPDQRFDTQRDRHSCGTPGWRTMTQRLKKLTAHVRTQSFYLVIQNKFVLVHHHLNEFLAASVGRFLSLSLSHFCSLKWYFMDHQFRFINSRAWGSDSLTSHDLEIFPKWLQMIEP